MSIYTPDATDDLCTIMQSRTAYEDWQKPDRRRRLLRLWLACPAGPPLPAVYRNYQHLTAGGGPNGILLPGVTLNAPIEAVDGGPGEVARRFLEGIIRSYLSRPGPDVYAASRRNKGA